MASKFTNLAQLSMKNIETQASQSSFNNGYYYHDHSNPSFSSSQTLDEAHQNDYSPISDPNPWLNDSSNDSGTINHGQCPTCLQPCLVAGTSARNQRRQPNNLRGASPQVPSTSFQTPELVQYEDQMTSTGGDNASSKALAAQQFSVIQAPQAQNLAQDDHGLRALQPATTLAHKKSRSNSTPKQRRRKNSNARCEICGHSFTRESDLQRHCRSVHVDRHLLCYFCDGKKAYSRVDKLNEHLRKKHPEYNMVSLGAWVQ